MILSYFSTSSTSLLIYSSSAFNSSYIFFSSFVSFAGFAGLGANFANSTLASVFAKLIGDTDVAIFATPDVKAFVPSGFLTHATITPITIPAATIATITIIIVKD